MAVICSVVMTIKFYGPAP